MKQKPLLVKDYVREHLIQPEGKEESEEDEAEIDENVGFMFVIICMLLLLFYSFLGLLY
jgi:hypothetical protein